MKKITISQKSQIVKHNFTIFKNCEIVMTTISQHNTISFFNRVTISQHNTIFFRDYFTTQATTSFLWLPLSCSGHPLKTKPLNSSGFANPFTDSHDNIYDFTDIFFKFIPASIPIHDSVVCFLISFESTHLSSSLSSDPEDDPDFDFFFFFFLSFLIFSPKFFITFFRTHRLRCH